MDLLKDQVMATQRDDYDVADLESGGRYAYEQTATGGGQPGQLVDNSSRRRSRTALDFNSDAYL